MPSMHEPTIRPAVLADLPAVRELMIELGYDVDADALDTTLRDLASNPHAVVLVSESEGRVDALLSMTFRSQLHVAVLTGTIDTLFRHEKILHSSLPSSTILSRLMQMLPSPEAGSFEPLSRVG